MDASFIAKKYFDAVKKGRIDAKDLIKLPTLLSCGNWDHVEIVGHVDYLHDFPKVHYNGVLVKHQNGLYYINQKAVDALSGLSKKFRRISTTIKVINQ